MVLPFVTGAAAASAPAPGSARRVRTSIAVHSGPATRVTAGTTLKKMRDHVRAELKLPIVWETARRIVANVTPRAELEQAIAIRKWITYAATPTSARFRFVNDPLWHQLLTPPSYVLAQIQKQGYAQGNCADAAMLAAALCEAIRIPCAFVAVAFNKVDAPYSHVFAIAYPRTPKGRVAVEMDVTRPAGVRHAHFTRRIRLEV